MTINGSTSSSGWTYKLEVTETSTSIQNRTSTIQVKTYLGRASSQSYLGGRYSNSVSITGASTQTQSGTISYPTYINGGAWLQLKTFTFTVPNTGNPTTVTISSSLSSNDFFPRSASASGTMQLTILHLDPTIEVADIIETNQAMINLNVPDTTIVPYLSEKRITLHATATDDATLSYKLEHLGTNYIIPADGFQNSNIFDTNYKQNDITYDSNNKARILQRFQDNLGGEASNWLLVAINGNIEQPNVIPYAKPNIERTSTSIKRKSGNGTNLTDNKANLNLKATFYKGNDVVGNNNLITQIGYKIWATDEIEPSSYTSLTPTISGGNITITDFEISNVIFTNVYNYKIIVTDNYGYSDEIEEGRIPIGKALWSEYRDRVDFEKLTVGGYNPFEYSTNETIVGYLNDGNDIVPIYRVYLTGTTSSSSSSIELISNVNKLINDKICVLRSPSSQYHPLSASMSGNSDHAYPLYIDDTQHKLRLYITNSQYQNRPFYGWVEYTKTTD